MYIETVTSGFMGYPIIIFIWIGRKLMAYSTDNKNTWKIIYHLIDNEK